MRDEVWILTTELLWLAGFAAFTYWAIFMFDINDLVNMGKGGTIRVGSKKHVK